MNDDVLVKVEGVSKKFSKDLKRSLFYGLQDIGKEVIGRSGDTKINLRKSEFWAVKDVSFELKRGECLGLIGRNGAGKTTLLKMLNGLVKPDQGRVSMKGQVGALIALGTGFDPILTGRENIYVNASVLGLKKSYIDEKIDEIINFAELGDFIEAPVRSYSSGMVSRLGFSIAVHMNPDILILDEVLAVGDAGFKMKSLNKIYEIMNRTAVIFVNHNMATLSRVSNKLLYLEKGKVEYFGDNVLKGIEMYLGQFDDEEGFIDFNEKAKFVDIKLTSSTFRGLDIKDRPILNHLDDLFIEMNYVLNDSCQDHCLSIAISNKDFLTIASHQTPMIPKSSDGKMSILLKIPRIQLTNGEYSITFKIYGDSKDTDNAENYATYRHWKKFKMEGLQSITNVPFVLEAETVVN
jgi:lipopolysaccharide transport system ATP-binding protein